MTDQRQTILGPVGRFFFSPTDPTTLGFMRILAGLVVLYCHAAYTPDFEEFLGPRAWWDHQAAQQHRRESPSMNSPLDWTLRQPSVIVDELPRRRAAEIEFLRSLPLDPAARKAKVRFLDRLVALTPAPKNAYDERARQEALRQYQAGLYLINAIAHLTEGQKAQVRVLLDTDTPDDAQSPVHFPEFLKALPRADRVSLWDDAVAFTDSLPAREPETVEYVLHWFGNYPFNSRPQLVRFLTGDLKLEDQNLSLPADAHEREQFLDYLSMWGADIRQVDAKGTPSFSVWLHLTDPTTLYAVHFAFLGVCVLFTIGLWTRVTSVLVWAGALNYIHRGELTLFGQDTMQTILLTYLMIGPSGAALSVDALRRRYRASKALLTSGGRAVPWAEAALSGPPKSWLANLAVRLFQINFCLIYASSGLSKLKGTTWWDHSAPWLIFANPEFGLIRYPVYEWLLRQAAGARVLLALFAGSVSLYTLVVELGLPVLIWTRLRPVMVCLSALLHFGIAVFMGLATFGLYMFTLVLCYVPAALIRERIGVTPGTEPKMTLRYNAQDPASVRTAARVRALDLAGQVTFVDEPRAGGAALVAPGGKEQTGRDLARTVLRELALLRPFRFLARVV